MKDYTNKMICRACLSDDAELLRPLLDNSNILSMYIRCSYLQVTTNDGLPMSLCNSCVDKCVAWNSFKEMCAQSESMLISELDSRIYKKPIESDEDMAVVVELSIEKPHLNDNKQKTVDNEQINIADESEEETETMPLEKLETFDENIIINNEIPADKLIVPNDNLESNNLPNNSSNKNIIKKQSNKSNKIDKHKTSTQTSSLVRNRLYKCETCKKIFNTILEIKSHIKKNHTLKQDNPQPFKCKICNLSFKLEYLLDSHYLQNHAIRYQIIN